MDTDRQRSLAAGMDDHASKPIDSETIAEILNRHIGSNAPVPQPETASTPGSVRDMEPVHLAPTVRV
jgi:hypothetical protein